MSNDASIAVVETNDAFDVLVIFGRSNLTTKFTKKLVEEINNKRDDEVFFSQQEALDQAQVKLREFVCEFGCYPVYGIEKLDFTQSS